MMAIAKEEREKALEAIRQLKLKLPAAYEFDREEANSRGDDAAVRPGCEPPTSNPLPHS
jgi:hypothetical protein